MRSVILTSLLVLAILVLGCDSQAFEMQMQNNIDRLGMGTYLRHIKTVRAVDDVFLHTFAISILPPANFSKYLNACDIYITQDHLRACQTFSDYIETLRRISATSTSYLGQLLQRVNQTIPYQPLQSKRLGSRSLIPLIGQGLSALF